MQTATQQRPIALLQPITPQSDFSQDQKIFRRKPRSVVDGYAGNPPAEAIQVGSAAHSSAERPAGNEPSRKIATFREEGDYWTLSFAGQTVRLKNIKGLAHIAYLIRRPGVDVHSIELARVAEAEFGEAEAGTPRSSVAELKASGLQVGYLGDAGELLDDQAKAAYRRRLSELREQEEEARALGQVQRAEELEHEKDVLMAELSRAIGLGKRNRVAASSSERARQSVTRAIKAALSRIADHHFPLGQMLARQIRTGTYCSYTPDPDQTIDWKLEAESSAQQAPVEPAGDQRFSAQVPVATSGFLRAARTEFVGRSSETALLQGLVQRALGGRRGLALIGGGPGVGKTRLAMEIAQFASREGFLCFAGGCEESGEPYPYLPFTEVIEAMLARSPSSEDFRRDIGDVGAELAQIAPSLRRVLPDLPHLPDLPAPQLPRFIFQGFAEFLSRASIRSPLLIVLNDLQWADEATLGLLSLLANQREPGRLVLLCTYRDGEIDSNPALMRILEELIRSGLRPLTLQGLSQGEVADVIRRLSKREPPLALVELAFGETQGNPFFLEEVYKHLVEEGKLFDSEGEFRSGLTLDENDVPEHIRLVLHRRLRRLGDKARQILTAAAAIGRNFSFELLQEVGSFEVGELLTAVEQAQRMGLVISTDGSDGSLDFAHELVRQTLLSGASSPRRQRLHLLVAKAIEELHAGSINEWAGALAYHLSRAGHLADPAKTAEYLWMAGKTALEGTAYEEAYRNFESAASYTRADLRRHAECLQGMERASRGVGNWDEALRRCNEAVEIYRRLGDNEMVASGIYETVDALLLMGQYKAAAETAERALAELKNEGGASRADIFSALGLIYTVFGDYPRAKNAFSEAMSMAEQLSNPRLIASIHTNWSALNGVALEADELFHSDKALEWSGCTNFPWMRAIALNGKMMALHRLGRPDEASNVSVELEPLARKTGHGVFLVTSLWTRAWAEFARRPNLTRLEEQLCQSVQLCRARVPMLAAQSLTQLSLAQFFCGREASALDCALEATQVQVPGYLGGFAAGTIFRERAYGADRAGAMAFLNDALLKFKLPSENQPNTLGSWALLMSVVEGLSILGEREQAADLYPLTRELLNTGMVTFCSIARFPQTIAGIAAAAGRQWDDAEEHFRIALQQAEQMPDRREQADIRRFFGAMLLEKGSPDDREQARMLLRDAVAGYSHIGMPRFIEVTKLSLARADEP